MQVTSDGPMSMSHSSSTEAEPDDGAGQASGGDQLG
jgi:hypothetical protein